MRWWRRRNFGWVLLAAALLIIGGALLGSDRRRPATNIANQPGQSAADQARERYANLTEAAWRQDQGQGSLLMTATLLVPPAIQALGQDTARSDYDDQLYRATRDLGPDALSFFITLDSAAGTIADETLTDSLDFTSADGRVWELRKWSPLIRPSPIANSGYPIAAQGGVAVFGTSQPIDWPSLRKLTLVSRNLVDVAERRFEWIEPPLLMEIE